ncbi:MAG: GNAT family N-acetyltransferase [Lachnospiraceae bacterium]|nr:GNAT family N-acetyltransferase [Lachnospiraceae bacterium]
MEIIKGYRDNEMLRGSLCDLANETFGIDLRSWYDAGFWRDDYIPYSVAEEGRIVSNVSVSVCNIKLRSRVHHLAQLGTVMTGRDQRNKGYCSRIMEKVISDCERSFEGTFLYAEDNMTEFYEQFGFRKIKEYQCRKRVNITNRANIEKVPVDSEEDRDRMVDIIQKKGQYGERIMVNNPGLFMFHITGPLSDCVYYLPSCESYAIARIEDRRLYLYAVFTGEKIGLGEVISSFGSDVGSVYLMFTPENNTGFDQVAIEDDENVLFVRGGFFESAGNERFMFPRIAQA